MLKAQKASSTRRYSIPDAAVTNQFINTLRVCSQKDPESRAFSISAYLPPAAVEYSAPLAHRRYLSASYETPPGSARDWYDVAVRYYARCTDNAGTDIPSRHLYRRVCHHFNMFIGTTWTNHLLLLIYGWPAWRSVFLPRLSFPVNHIPAGCSAHGYPARPAWWHQ